MNDDIYPLNTIRPGESAVISRLTADGAIRRRLLDLGFSSGTKIVCVLRQRHGEGAAYLVRGTVIALRKEDAAGILVRDDGDRQIPF